MSSTKSEYQRFLAYLATVEVSDNVRRMANLVMVNLPQLEEVGATRRARSKRLAPLAIARLLQTPTELDSPPPQAGDNLSLGRLHELAVGPFRGFMRQERFDLGRDITLVYGANGTGKSSFCEALEFAMLGSIGEAQVKRLDLRLYCNNARLRSYVAPRLTSQLGDGTIQQVRPSENAYRFCFIEKNRLDDFARIAARTPGDQRQLIATLFGVDEFSNFVRGFNPSLDDDLQLVGTSALQLDSRRMQLAASEQIIRSYADRVAQFDQQEHELAQRSYPGCTFVACCQWLEGTPERQGRLAQVHAALANVPPTIYGTTQANLQQLLADVYRVAALWQTATAQLADRAADVSYAQLYNALLGLSAGATACPACGTDLRQVAHDPFEHARTGLQQLAQLAELQRQEQQYRNNLADALRTLLLSMKAAVNAAASVVADMLRSANLPPLPEVSIEGWLAAWLNDDHRAWRMLLSLVACVERWDAEARLLHEQRRMFEEERIRLDGFRLEIERCRTLRATAAHELANAQAAVAQFEVQNRDLIAEVAREAITLEQRRVIKAAYDGYLPQLQSYLAGLPARLLQGLATRARDLYNAFNRDDPRSDLLHDLRLPMVENGKIELEFIGDAGVRYDALVVLSEGHIKCLGLAILLAKNLAQGCPVVIFDDVVNAIDDEHRNGIWRTFFEDGILEGKQIILTSHAEEFLLRIQQELGAQRVRQSVKLYKFLPHLGEHELRVDSDPPTKNYVLLCQEALAQGEKRDALRYARSAIESLTDRVWVWLGSRTDGKLELGLTGPRAKWELNNKCTKLRAAIGRIPANPGTQAAIEAMNVLLGINGGSIEWRYLNAGTHDAQLDHEFDHAAVRTIVEAVVHLDAALAVLRGR